MKAKSIQNILVIVICGVAMISLGNIDLLPWWSFLVPVMIVGNVITLLKLNLNAFLLGFIAGFLIWFGGNLLFDVQYNGAILIRLAALLGVHKIVLLLLSGMIGGLLTGLALYVGRNIFKIPELPGLE